MRTSIDILRCRVAKCEERSKPQKYHVVKAAEIGWCKCRGKNPSHSVLWGYCCESFKANRDLSTVDNVQAIFPTVAIALLSEENKTRYAHAGTHTHLLPLATARSIERHIRRNLEVPAGAVPCGGRAILPRNPSASRLSIHLLTA